MNSNNDFVQALTKQGGVVYIVGGYVRDKLMKIIHKIEIEAKDIDICVEGFDLHTVAQILEKYGKVKEVGKSFGILTFHTNNSEYDIAVPRTERSTGDGYKDFATDHGSHISIRDDMLRRDTTINAIGYRIESVNDIPMDIFDMRKILDVVGGVDDLRSKIIRAVGNPEERFREDGTRILRLFRQSCKLDFTIEKQTQNSALQRIDLLKKIIQDCPVRGMNEIVRLLSYKKCSNLILTMSDIFALFDISLDPKIVDKIDIQDPAIALLCLKEDLDEAWIKRFDLTSCPNFSSDDVVFLRCLKHTQKFIDRFLDKSLDINCQSVSELICLIDPLNRNYHHLPKHRLYCELRGLTKDVIDIIFGYIKLKWTIPRRESQLAIKGEDITKRFGVTGKCIGNIKKHLFQQILLGKIDNNHDDLIDRLSEIVDKH